VACAKALKKPRGSRPPLGFCGGMGAAQRSDSETRPRRATAKGCALARARAHRPDAVAKARMDGNAGSAPRLAELEARSLARSTALARGTRAGKVVACIQAAIAHLFSTAVRAARGPKAFGQTMPRLRSPKLREYIDSRVVAAARQAWGPDTF